MVEEYKNTFGVKTFLSTELQNKAVYNKLVADGYVWIKQKHISKFHRVVRFPTVGHWVEVSRTGEGHYVEINSTKGRKLINKLCYYI